MSGKEVHSLEDIQIGDNIGPEPLFLAKDRVRAYCDAAGLHGVPRFTDDELARKEGLPGMITPGNMSAALVGKLVTDWALPAHGRLVRLGTTYRSPVLPEHNLTLHGFVTEVDHGGRTAEVDIWIENEDGDRLVTATATIQFPPKS
jgi:acyl dehydratase